MSIETLNFNKKRIAPAQVAALLKNNKSINVDLPANKLKHFLSVIPKHFEGRLKMDLVARNASAKEMITGTLLGSLLGLGVGAVLHIVKKVHPAIMIASTLIGAGVAYFTVRYRIDFYIKYGPHDERIAHLKFRKQSK